MYLRLLEEGDELLNLEIGTLSEFTQCSEIQFFLDNVQEKQLGYASAPLNDCLVRRISSRVEPPFLHRPNGPALLIEHMATGHKFFQVHSLNGLRHRIDGPARVADDLNQIHEEYFYNNRPFRRDGPDSIFIQKSTGEIIDTITWGDGQAPDGLTIEHP